MILAVSLAALAIFLWLAITLWRFVRVSRAEDIGDRRQGTALLLIDLQKDFLDDGPYPPEQRAQALEAASRAALQARRNGWPVIAVRQAVRSPSLRLLARLALGGKGMDGTAGSDLVPEVAALSDHVLSKEVKDAFASGELDRLLAQHDVAHLRIAGLDGEHCVRATCMAALQHGYNVTLLSDAILTARQNGWDKVAQQAGLQGVTVGTVATLC
ncbi:cysteine hydrolase [Defluviimonas sp. WL0050]|uniref:Cysteine hydrolase n=1 Tax=Albidovulum litorale TaxID=2984134 RepID=A0ABT2ZSZ3_9RHOB|nr:isochorismatase family cysteine hydrolase [Defluviimonas sp. WL0050]MCV2873871.1 cysteine hydrolase [Defluviimonas sp. WL0050]